MNILVAGGAGYIGSHTVLSLLEGDNEVVILDNLECGYKESVLGGTFYEGNISDSKLVSDILKKHKIDVVMHFCAYIEVGESVSNPRKYYENNVMGSFKLLNTMLDCGVKRFVFSSTAAVYGEPSEIPLSEKALNHPSSPYGQTKFDVENMLKSYNRAYGLDYVVLRYFNACGAHPNGKIGEAHNPESHLIPIVLQVPLGKRDKVYIYGDDYETRDGTCVRDYIHVCDIADAHILSAKHLSENGGSKTYNLGTGVGYTVKEVIDTCSLVVGEKIPYDIEDRRDGDTSTLVASSSAINKELGWSPKYDNLKSIVETAWNWHKNNADGYSK